MPSTVLETTDNPFGAQSRVAPRFRKNVLFLHGGGNWIRGSENALLTLLRGIDRSMVEPFLFCSHQELAARAPGIESTVAPLPEIMVDSDHRRLQFLGWMKTVLKLRSLVRQKQIDLIYCNGGSTLQVGYYVAKLCGIPVICHIHSPYSRRYIILYRFHLASKLIFVSEAIKTQINARHRLRAGCEVVHNGVDVQRFHPAKARDSSWKQQLGLEEGTLVFGQVSSLIRRKGIDLVLKAFRTISGDYPQARLVLVGDGPEDCACRSLAATLGITHKVVFAGEIADPVPIYQHVFDVNVLASRSDAFPLSLLEAAACGVPSIAAAVDGIPEAVKHGTTGLLFDAENVEMLSQNMRVLLRMSELRSKLGQAARLDAVARFSNEQYCGSIQRIILEQPSLRKRYSRVRA